VHLTPPATNLPTETTTPLPPTAPAPATATATATATPTPATLIISKIEYAPVAPGNEHLELFNPTDAPITVPIGQWRMRVTVPAGSSNFVFAESGLTGSLTVPPKQRCRIYTSKPAPTPDQLEPCGFRTFNLVEDSEGIYVNRPGVVVELFDENGSVYATYSY
jgi:hypothetical protein